MPQPPDDDFSGIVAITVSYETSTPEGPVRVTLDLGDLLEHCRPDRVSEMLDDLSVLAEDVVAVRQPDAVIRVVPGPTPTK